MTAFGFTNRDSRNPDPTLASFHERGLDEQEQTPRDWKKIVLVLGLGALSWVATYVGMLELIEANMGALDIATRIIVAGSVAMLMVMIIWLLDQLFQPVPFITKLIYAMGYVFLTLISVGFGFGFYWKVLESRSEATRSGESAVMQVKSGMHAVASRLGQLEVTLGELTQISNEQAEIERTHGTSCPNSRPGDGPRKRLREEEAARFGFAANFVKGRAGQVKAEMSSLDTDLARITTRDATTFDKTTGTRNEFMKGVGRKLELTATGFNAFRTDPQLRQIRADLAERGDKTTFPDGKGGTFACPDAKLQTALKGVVRAIDQLPELSKPQIATVEGSEAVIEAFRRLTATFVGAMTFRMPPSADELRELQRKAVQSTEAGASSRSQVIGVEQAGLSRRDYVPLAIAAFVDLCLLLVSMGRSTNRMQALLPKMRAAERGPIYPILSMFSDIHRDPEIREKFEVFRHVVFDFSGDYYVAVPLNAPYNLRRGRYDLGYSSEAATNLQLEAHLLSNLFASFEHERIFTRVYNPLLTTRSIQKKLWRQGSKFAGADAFRLYRFKRGAWSDIILGAVMGAHRRAESERRQRRIAAGLELTIPAGHAATAAAPPAVEPSHHAASGEALRSAAGAMRRETSEMPAYGIDPTRIDSAQATAYAAAASQRPPLPAAATTHPDHDEDLVRRFGPYAAAAAQAAERIPVPPVEERSARRRYDARPRQPEEALVAIDQLPAFQHISDMPPTNNVVAMPRRNEAAAQQATSQVPPVSHTTADPISNEADTAAPSAQRGAGEPSLPLPAVLLDHVIRHSENVLSNKLDAMPATITVRLAEMVVASKPAAPVRLQADQTVASYSLVPVSAELPPEHSSAIDSPPLAMIEVVEPAADPEPAGPASEETHEEPATRPAADDRPNSVSTLQEDDISALAARFARQRPHS